MEKTCTKCGETRLIVCFGKDKRVKSGRRSMCSDCKREYNKEYRETHPQVCGNAGGKKYKYPYKLKSSRAYYIKNKEKVKETNHKRHKEHPEIIRRHASLRRARLNNADGNGWTDKQEKELKNSYDNRCAYCGKKFGALEMDHIIPLTRGGDHKIENIVPACRSCNAGKFNRPLLVWMWRTANI